MNINIVSVVKIICIVELSILICTLRFLRKSFFLIALKKSVFWRNNLSSLILDMDISRTSNLLSIWFNKYLSEVIFCSGCWIIILLDIDNGNFNFLGFGLCVILMSNNELKLKEVTISETETICQHWVINTNVPSKALGCPVVNVQFVQLMCNWF